MIWLAALTGVAALGALVYWLFITTEGVFLGRVVVVWLYDRTAARYDRIKRFDPDFEAAFLARPLLRRLDHLAAPLVLDVATGTGRLPALLLEAPDFHGRVVGLDASLPMLRQAQRKCRGHERRLCFVQQTAVPLPMPDAACDAVACVEALEFLPSPEAALGEMVRVLKPGGVFLVTRRTGREARAFLGRYRSRPAICAQLEALGLVDVTVQAWQVDYDQVFARKPAATATMPEEGSYE